MVTTVKIHVDEFISRMGKLFYEIDWMNFHIMPDFADGIIDGVLLPYLQEMYERNRSPKGQKWAKLDSQTVRKRKVNRDGASQILVDTGRLKNSLTSEGNKDSVRRVTKNTLTIGTKTPYAEFHMNGTIRNLPPRPMMFFPNEDIPSFAMTRVMDMLKQAARDHIEKELNGWE